MIKGHNFLKQRVIFKGTAILKQALLFVSVELLHITGNFIPYKKKKEEHQNIKMVVIIFTFKAPGNYICEFLIESSQRHSDRILIAT